MWWHVLRRLALTVPTFFGITLFAFFLIRLAPGDPILVLAGERGVSPERYEQLRALYGFDQPLVAQYAGYLWRVLHGDLGVSVVTRTPVLTEFLHLFPATVELSLVAITFAVVVGLPAGVVAAVRRNTVLDYSVMGVSLVGYSMPIFWWALLLILLFSVTLGVTPVSGRIGFAHDVVPVSGFLLVDSLLAGDVPAFVDALHHLVLPAIVLGTIPLAVVARMTRSAMLEVLREDYVRTARAKGLSPARVVFHHALRNALIPVVTVIGLQVSVLLTGAILTETIFSWPGIGKWLLESVYRRDYPAVQGGVLLVACLVIAVNVVVDLLYAVINPRMRR